MVSCLFSTYGLLAIIGVFHQYAIVSLEIIASDRIIALRDKGGLTIGGFGPENELERALAEEALPDCNHNRNSNSNCNCNPNPNPNHQGVTQR